MAHTKELSGPDLAAGIEVSRARRRCATAGHAHGDAVMLVRSGTTIRAVGATCTHYSGPLAEGLVVGETVRCPWHHACFDLRTGEALGAPALDPIPCYEVVRSGDRVTVGRSNPGHRHRAPPNAPSKIVIAGAGAGGAAAAEKLRRLGLRGRAHPDRQRSAGTHRPPQPEQGLSRRRRADGVGDAAQRCVLPEDEDRASSG